MFQKTTISDMQTDVCTSEGECYFFEKFCVRTKWTIPCLEIAEVAFKRFTGQWEEMSLSAHLH